MNGGVISTGTNVTNATNECAAAGKRQTHYGGLAPRGSGSLPLPAVPERGSVVGGLCCSGLDL